MQELVILILLIGEYNMYENLKFAPALPFVQTKDVQEAIRIASDITVESVNIKLEDIKINTDATINYGRNKNITEFGFENLCKLLGIPKPFAQKIPVDLLFQNIKRLQTDKAALEISLLMRPDDSIANIVKSPYNESSYLDVLSNFSDRIDLKYINIGERLLTICLAFEDMKLSKDEDDVLYLGTYVYNSIVREMKLSMFSGLYRITCENSLIAPFLGTFKASYTQKEEIRLLRFVENIRCYENNIFSNIEKNFRGFDSRFLYEYEMLKIWGDMDRLVGEMDADLVLNTNPEDRKVLQENVRAWKSTNAREKLVGRSVIEAPVTNVLAYDAINAITNHAKSLSGIERRDVEKVGGKLLQYFILN